MTDILIGKFGKHISFDSKKWGMVGGDSESAILISCMAQCYPCLLYTSDAADE